MRAEERREYVLEAALREFALGGLHGTSAEAIAARAGISQPYLFRLFNTKRELFLAVVDRVFDRTLEALQRAAADSPDTAALSAFSQAWNTLLDDRETLLAQVQVFAACADDEVRIAVRRRFAECYRYVERASGASEEAVRGFFAGAMLQTVAAAMRLDELAAREPWARRVVASARS